MRPIDLINVAVHFINYPLGRAFCIIRHMKQLHLRYSGRTGNDSSGLHPSLLKNK